MKNRRIDPKTDPEIYRQMVVRDMAFRVALDDIDTSPVKVFDPLTKIQTDQLEMIRELSKTLQVKKDEDIRKQKQTAEELAAEEENNSSEEKEKSVEEQDVPDSSSAEV